MARLVNAVRKNCRPGETTRNIIEVWCSDGVFFATIIKFESNFRNVETYYVNSGQDNQKYMRFWGQPGRIRINIIDFKIQCQ